MIRGGRDRKRKPFSGRGSGGIIPAADRNAERVRSSGERGGCSRGNADPRP
jgi:hypothetical protein